jgi:predicted CopG family antitoxin
MLSENTNKYKQILIDVDNYSALKDLGKTGDSFNKIIGKLINSFKTDGAKA